MSDRAQYLATDRRVIGIRAGALKLLEEALDGGFSEAIETILAVKGRVARLCRVDEWLEITRKGFGVVRDTAEDGRPAGIIADGDLRRHKAGLLPIHDCLRSGLG